MFQVLATLSLRKQVNTYLKEKPEPKKPNLAFFVLVCSSHQHAPTKLLTRQQL